MTIVKARQFTTRQELENHIKGLVGLSSELKPDFKIEGKREELQRLHLTDQTVFWGIACKITDSPTKTVATNKPNRGEIFKSKIT